MGCLTPFGGAIVSGRATNEKHSSEYDGHPHAADDIDICPGLAWWRERIAACE
jgi:hypothetical protein